MQMMPIRQSMHKQASACTATCPSCKEFAVQAPHSYKNRKGKKNAFLLFFSLQKVSIH